METKIIGSVLPVVEVQLAHGETFIGAPEQLSWLSGGITLHSSASAAGGGGVWGLVSRAVSGGGIVMTEFRAEHGPGVVGFAAHLPGQIIEIEVSARGYVSHRHGFVCGSAGITLSSALQQGIGAGAFGGEGFILQKIGGEGRAFIELGGEIVTYDLAAGQSILAHPGHIGLFDDGVQFEVVTMNGIRNTFFASGELFMARLTGPGRVWLQTLTMPGLAHALSHYLPNKQG